jgi:putative hydrolase of HD superfamily
MTKCEVNPFFRGSEQSGTARQESVVQIIDVLHVAEKLKYTLRHSWLSNGRQESVADHSWRMALMAVLVLPHLESSVDIARLLKIVIVHDLVEAVCGDIPAHELADDVELCDRKRNAEINAIEQLSAMLPSVNGQEIKALWNEFEEAKTAEAKVALALDKLEAQIQHNEADPATWLESEKKLMLGLGRYTAFDEFLISISEHAVRAGTLKFEIPGDEKSQIDKDKNCA